MRDYKTPGVYTEEISTLPPSVAPVDTAIPAFIGYTEYAREQEADDLMFHPFAITSMMEYENHFGGPPPLKDIEVIIDNNNAPKSVYLQPQYLLYDSLQLFFANGGGRCYVISVGKYGQSIALGDADEGLLGGLSALRKEDEPTLIVCPEAAKLEDTSLYGFQQQALRQAGDLKDRFVICDLKNSDNHKADVEEFRDKIGISELKYGAAYTPWLKARTSKAVKLRDINLKRAAGSGVQLENLAKEQAIKGLIAATRAAQQAVDDILDIGSSEALQNDFNTQLDDFNALDPNADSPPSLSDIRNALRSMYMVVIGLATRIRDLQIADQGSFKLAADLAGLITLYNISGNLQQLIYYSRGFDNTPIITATNVNAISAYYNLTNANDPAVDEEYSNAGAEPYPRGLIARDAAVARFPTFLAFFNDLVATAQSYEAKLNAGLADSFGLYSAIVKKIKDTLSELPPSGAIAGVYARVDGARGVFKAPANVSLNGVIQTNVKISNDDQDTLNVHPTGKSINAIRSFPGKGILVWGARTLDGNSNEWRYVSVRRLFNFVEESISKSIERFVFEPNDEGTWIKVKGTIENFLTDQWRAGALAGSTTEQAFFVHTGLGITMTPQDILEGRLIVDVGVAAVRPAEFILLRFSHKLQEA